MTFKNPVPMPLMTRAHNILECVDSRSQEVPYAIRRGGTYHAIFIADVLFRKERTIESTVVRKCQSRRRTVTLRPRVPKGHPAEQRTRKLRNSPHAHIKATYNHHSLNPPYSGMHVGYLVRRRGHIE